MRIFIVLVAIAVLAFGYLVFAAPTIVKSGDGYTLRISCVLSDDSDVCDRRGQVYGGVAGVTIVLAVSALFLVRKSSK